MHTTDDYGEVTNSEETYEVIAKALAHAGSCVIGWTDELSTHYDILLACNVPQLGNLQGGQRGPTSLFVCLLRCSGGFGFSLVRSSKPIHVSYVAEKLGLDPASATTGKITDLINGILDRTMKFADEEFRRGYK